jgi:hypothetical protein
LEIIIIVLSVGVLLVFWGKGRSSFMRALREFRDGFDQGAFDAGQSLGGIHGKPAAEALIPENATGELYDPFAVRRR